MPQILTALDRSRGLIAARYLGTRLALARSEGIIPALESSHAVAYAMRLAQEARDGTTILVNLSGRGDKDVQSVTEALQ